jgi:hypothetical protein
MKIPEAPYMHPDGVQLLAKLSFESGNSAATLIALYLITLLQEPEQNNLVKTSIDNLAINLSMSVATVNVNLAFLRQHKFIYSAGKQCYRISPRLAWKGTQVDWAEKLYLLRQEDKTAGITNIFTAQ